MKQNTKILTVIVACIILSCIKTNINENVKIGAYYADALNGIVFIHDDQAAFLLRIGWLGPDQRYQNGYIALSKIIEKFDISAPDGSISKVPWKVGNVKVCLYWGKNSETSIIGRIVVDGHIRIALEANQAWEFPSIYNLREKGIDGISQYKGKKIKWRLRTNEIPIAQICSNATPDLIMMAKSKVERQGKNVALFFDLDKEMPLEFVAGFDSLEDLSKASSFLLGAQNRYKKHVVRATGDWGDFIEPITNNLNNSKVYNFKTGIIAHTVSRAWCRDDNDNEPVIDGQVLFAWDSFFNGILASNDDPVGAKNTIRAILATQLANGMVPNMYGPRRGITADRSQFPIGAMGVWKLHQRWPDIDFLTEVYPKLKRWHEWWFSPRPSNGLPYRDGNQNGLLEFGSETGFFLNAKYEGLDDSPAFDFAKMNIVSRTMELDAVGLNAIWAMDAEYLSFIAAEIGKIKEADKFRTECQEMNKRMNQNFWNERLGIYCDHYWNLDSKVDRREGESIPSGCLFSPTGKHGLKAEYFKGINFDTLIVSRIDQQINTSSIQSNPEVGNKYFSVRWTGRIKPKTTQKYIFSLACNDGGRLWLNGEKIIDDDWKGHQKFVNISDPIFLEAGAEVKIKLEYFQGGGTSYISFGWYPHESKPIEADSFSLKLTPLNFYPMISGAPNEDQAKRMLAILKNSKKFWGNYVCPTVSRDDPSFTDQQYWRGTIWPPTNYLLHLGLKRYANPELMNNFADKSVTLFMKNWLANGSCYENFYADGSGAKDPHYTWGTLLCLIGVENICDIDPNGAIVLNGTLDKNIEIKNLPLLGDKFDVLVTNGITELILDNNIIMEAKGRIKKKNYIR